MTIIKMFTDDVTAPADGLAAIDSPEDGKIVGIDIAAMVRSAAAGTAACNFELSFGASNAFTTIDARQVIAEFGVVSGTPLAATKVCGVLNKFIPVDLDIAAGERIFLHWAQSLGTAVPDAMAINVLIHLNFKSGARPRYRK